MASGCGDVLTLEDLKTAKKHQLFEAEVITGKQGGVAGGVDIDYATNQVTGQVQKTMPAVIRDMEFTPASFTFTTGGTLGINDADKGVLWPIADGGDGVYYRWAGSFPKTIPAASTPGATGGVSPSAWVPTNDLTLRTDLSLATGAAMVGYKDYTVADHLDKHTSRVTINVSNYGNTGTVSSGSNAGWDAAFAYAIAICPVYSNQIGQTLYDLSGFEFVSDTPVYPKTPITFRSTYGLSIGFNIILPDDFSGTFAINSSGDFPVAGNKRPHQTRVNSNIDCRYKASGIYVNDFIHFEVTGRISKFRVYGVQTGTSGNELIVHSGATIAQRDWASTGDASFPADITYGIGIDINAADAIVDGAVVQYYYSIGIAIRAPGCFVQGGTHIYAAGKPALYQASTGAALNINGVNFDSSRCQLDAGYASVINCQISLYEDSPSAIGVLCGTNATNIVIANNRFIGNTSGTTPVYFNRGILADTTIVVRDNTYVTTATVTSDEFIRSTSVTVRGSTTAGVATMDTPNCYLRVRYDGKLVSFEMRVRWTNLVGAAGDLEITGLPLASNIANPHATALLQNISALTGCTAFSQITTGNLKLLTPTGGAVAASVTAGDIIISGKYSPKFTQPVL